MRVDAIELEEGFTAEQWCELEKIIQSVIKLSPELYCNGKFDVEGIYQCIRCWEKGCERIKPEHVKAAIEFFWWNADRKQDQQKLPKFKRTHRIVRKAVG